MSVFDNCIILIIGGIGLFGKWFVSYLLMNVLFKKVIIYLWDEFK